MNDATTWSKRIADWRHSGKTAADYSAEHGLPPRALYDWSARLKRAAKAKAASRPRLPIAKVITTLAEGPVGGEIVVELGGARVRIARGFDRATLGVVIAVLAERSPR